MRLSHQDFSKNLNWDENSHLCELVVESQTLMRSILKDLTSDSEERRLCIANPELLKIESDIDVIFNPLCLDFNNRRAITTLLKIILKTSLSEDFYLSTNLLKTKIIKHLSDIIDSENFAFEVETGDFAIDAIAKATNIHIVGDEDDFIELIIDYLTMMTELVHIKLFVFINLRSLITFAEFKQLAYEIQNHQIDVLFIENVCREKIDNCERIIIDQDLCEL